MRLGYLGFLFGLTAALQYYARIAVLLHTLIVLTAPIVGKYRAVAVRLLALCVVLLPATLEHDGRIAVSSHSLVVLNTPTICDYRTVAIWFLALHT